MKQRHEFWELYDVGGELIKELIRLHYLRRIVNDLDIALQVEDDYSKVSRQIINKSSTVLDNEDVIVIHSHFDGVTEKMAVCFGKIMEKEPPCK
jgi:hypothetical protein